MDVKKHGVLLGIILCIALFLRLYQLGDVPSGFHQDEVANAYLGRYVLENGVDIHGNPWPIFFIDKRGDYPPVIPMYLSALGTYVFGLNPLGARSIPAVIGGLAVIPVYFLASWMFKRRSVAAFAALMLAIVPWHMSFSRVGAEGIMASTFFLFGLMMFVLSHRTKMLLHLLGSLALFFLTYLLYPSFRVFVPLTLCGTLVVTYRALSQHHSTPTEQQGGETNTPMSFFLGYIGNHLKNIGTIVRTPALWKKNMFLLTVLGSFVLSLIVTAGIASTEWGKGRYDQTSIISMFEGENSPVTGFIFNEDNPVIARIFNNKPVYIVREFIKQYLSYLSPVFLFVEGGQPPWFDVPNTGLLFISFIFLLVPFFLPSSHVHWKKIDGTVFLLTVYLFFASIIPAALTNEFSPHTHRSIIMAPLFILVISYGFFQITQLKQVRRVVISIFVTALVVESIFSFHNYFQHVGNVTANLRGAGNLEASAYVAENKDGYDRLHMMASGWFPMYYLFSTENFDPGLAGSFHRNLRIDAVENVSFHENDCPLPDYFRTDTPEVAPQTGESALLVVNSICELKVEGFTQIDEIYNAEGHGVYKVYAFEN